MDKKFFIVGETCSGKDAIVKALCNNLNLKAVVSYTNRPMRAIETDGVEHYFLSRKEFNKLKKDKDNIVAYTRIYKPKNKLDEILTKVFPFLYSKKGYEYLATKSELEKSDLYIIDPKGINYLMKKHPEIDFAIIYIHANVETRIKRFVENRSENIDIFMERCKNESDQFTEFFAELNVDFRHNCDENKINNKTVKLIRNEDGMLDDAIKKAEAFILSYKK